MKQLFVAHAFVASLSFTLVSSAVAADSKSVPPPPTVEDLLKSVKAPPGWRVTVFAMPPQVNYPTCIDAAPTGEVFVGVDQTGSLGHQPDAGWVLRCIDS